MRLVCRFKRGALGFRENCALARSASSPICVLRLPIDDPHYVCASGRSRDCCGNWPKTYATGADWISEKPSSALSSVRRLRGTGVGLTKCGKGAKLSKGACCGPVSVPGKSPGNLRTSTITVKLPFAWRHQTKKFVDMILLACALIILRLLRDVFQ